MKKKTKICAAIMGAVVFITAVLGGIAVFAAGESSLVSPSNGENIYGEDYFDAEYSTGSFCITNTYGPDGTSYGGTGNGDTWSEGFTFTNTSRSSSVYVDHYNGARYGNVYYDVREYVWIGGGDEDTFGSIISSGLAGMRGASGLTSNYVCREFHFYEAGTLNSNNPVEVSWKGILRLQDLDEGEGYTFTQGLVGVWLTDPTHITYRGSNTWKGVWENGNDDINWEYETLWAEVKSSASSPLILKYWACGSHGSAINYYGNKISYQFVSSGNYVVPSGATTPTGTYCVTYGQYNLLSATTYAGYTFSGWYTNSSMTTKASSTMVITADTTLYGGYILQYGNLKVTKESEDGVISGVKFRLYGTSTTGTAVDVTATTNSSGVATFSDVLVGTYTLTEVDTASYYITPSSQTVTISYNTTATATVENVLKRGNLKVTKETEDGVISGITFRLFGISDSGAAVDLTATTNSSGVATFSNVLIGTYSLAEVDTADYYITPAVQTITISYNATATATVENVLKRGNLKVTKTSEDGLTSDVKFRIYGTSDSGAAVDVTATTNSSGIATFSDVLIGTYTLVEVDTAVKYVVPAAQTVTVAYNTTVSAEVTNVLKKFRVTLTKIDSETTSAQGDATLEGAVYGIYCNGELVDTYTTDENGQFTTDYYICGDDNWTIQEITPSEGYLLDETAYSVGAAKNYTVEYSTTAVNSKEDVIKGTIAIVKHNDLGDRGIDTPEDGAVFQIYLASAGSYDNAKSTERDTLTTDENGYATTKDLPYGTYTVHQVSGWEGRYLIDDFNVYIIADGKVYRYLLNNSYFEGYLKIVKVDAETGETIPCAGAAFQIYDTTGNLITMSTTYPETETVDTFYTNDEGYLVTPETLVYGINYSIVETQAPEGYVLDSTPVYFSMTDDCASDETVNDVRIVIVEIEDMPQKGTITVSKTGEVFSTVEQTDDTYQAIYEEQGLSGATYQITAAEDIYTGDGTLRYSEGEVVDTITTGEDGTATSKELYLGAYNVQEIEAPYGMTLNSETHTVELTYAGQEVEITETSTSFVNDRQKVTVSLDKLLEVDDDYGIGANGEITSVAFALCAAEKLTATDGSTIPADGLLEVAYCDENGAITFSSNLPLGSYYVEECATDAHYTMSNEKYAFTFDYAGQDVELVTIALNDGTTIENDLIRGSVSGLKLDEDGNLVENALFGIFSIGTTEFTKDTAIAVSASDVEGKFGFEDVPYGTWIVREISAPDCYVVDDTPHYVVVSRADQIVEVEVVNEFVTGTIELTKIDADYFDSKLTGATFEVYQDTDNDGEYVSGSDLSVGTMTEVEEGVYQMEELRYGGYFVREITAPEGFVLDENVYYVFVEEDGETYLVENEEGTGYFSDEPQRGVLKIIKTSSDGKVEGFSFQVSGSDHIETFTTDENGEILIEGLRIGEYTVSEVADEASAGYVLPEAQTVIVVADETVIVEMYNTLAPKTGMDNSKLVFAIVGAALASAGLVACGLVCFFRYRSKRRKLSK